MRWVVRWLSLCMLLSCSHLQAGKAVDYQQLIRQEAKTSGVPANLIQSVIQVESSFRETVVSPKGAQGLMQLMPATAERFGVKDAFNPQQNIRGGTQYLRWLYQRYQHWPLVLAAYNAGEQKVDKYGGIPPYRETQHYVRKVLQHYAKLTGEQTPIQAAKGRVLQAVFRSAGDQSSQLKSLPEKRNLEEVARSSSVCFAD